MFDATLTGQLVARLAERRRRLVLAESCTGGLISAELAKIPGVSEWLCGSAVTYRCDTKSRWLGVSPDDIETHTAVSEPVARQMAEGVLRSTPEASIAGSITGHLGPQAPAEFDGVVFIGIARRDGDTIRCQVSRHQLKSLERQARQIEAAELVMRRLLAM